jgi:hypothetical protein
MNLQNIITFIDNEVKHAEQHSRFYLDTSNLAEAKYWQGYAKAMNVAKSRIEQKIQAKKEKSK